jgi:hypothetical protein
MINNERDILTAAKAEILLDMYRSVDRMNGHIMAHTEEVNLNDSIVAEQHVQQVLRACFRDLQADEGTTTEL